MSVFVPMFFFLFVCIFHRFTPAEVAFLGEYVKVMCPVAKAIDVLQGETSVQMGWLIPTITVLKKKLHNLRLSSKCCVPLIEALQVGFEKRFGEMLKDPEFIAATILLPKFRRCWTTDEDILKLGLLEEVLIFIYSRGKKLRDHCKIVGFFSGVTIYRYMLE